MTRAGLQEEIRDKETIHVYNDLSNITKKINDIGVNRLKTFQNYRKKIKKLMDDFGSDKIPNKYIFKKASKSLAAEIQKQYQEEKLGKKEIDLLEPVFAKLKYVDLEGAKEALKTSKERSRLIKKHRKTKKKYRKLFDKKTRKVRELRQEIGKKEEQLSILDSYEDLDKSIKVLQKIKKQISSYNQKISQSLNDFIKKDSSQVIEFLLFCEYFPEINPPKPRNRSAAKKLSKLNNLSVFKMLEIQEYSKKKMKHVVENPEELKDLVDQNIVWLKRITKLPETDFMKLKLEKPRLILQRIQVLKRLLPKVNGPTKKAREIEKAIQKVDPSLLKIQKLVEKTGKNLETIENDLKKEINEFREKLEIQEDELNKLDSPEKFQLN